MDEPLWFVFMRNCRWTVKRIQREFSVTRAIAQHIQHAFPSLRECRAIAAASEELISQVGH